MNKYVNIYEKSYFAASVIFIQQGIFYHYIALKKESGVSFIESKREKKERQHSITDDYYCIIICFF